jgi:hypothetical protein
VQCRPLDRFDDFNYNVCYKHLSNTSMYYQPSPQWQNWDGTSSPGGGFIAIFTDTFKKFFADPECMSNVEAILCHAAFRECQEVEDEWFPSLMCQSECEKNNAIWDTCLNTLKSDPELKLGFDTAVIALVRIFSLCVHCARAPTNNHYVIICRKSKYRRC